MPEDYFSILRTVVPMCIGVVHAVTRWKFRTDRVTWRVGWTNPLFAALMLIVLGYVAFIPYQRLWGIPLIFASLAFMLWVLAPRSTVKKTTYAKD